MAHQIFLQKKERSLPWGLKVLKSKNKTWFVSFYTQYFFTILINVDPKYIDYYNLQQTSKQRCLILLVNVIRLFSGCDSIDSLQTFLSWEWLLKSRLFALYKTTLLLKLSRCASCMARYIPPANLCVILGNRAVGSKTQITDFFPLGVCQKV